MRILVSLIITIFCFSAFSQQKIKLEEIMKGYDFIGHPPRNHVWSWDNKRIYFEWNPNKELEYSYYYWEEGLNEPKLLALSDYRELELTDQTQRSKKIIYYLKDGALFAFFKASKKHQKLIHTSQAITKIIPSKSDELVYFQQDMNLFEYNFTNHTITQLSNFKKGTKPNSSKNESNFLKEQQKELFLYIDKQNKKKALRKEKQELSAEKFPKAVFIGDKDLENLQLSSDGKHLLFRLSQYPENLQTNFENHITETGYTKTEKAREKVSITAISKHELGIINLENDSLIFVDFTNLSDFNKQPAYYSLYKPNENKQKGERQIVMHEAVFSPNSSDCIIDIRSQDNKDRWIINLDSKTGKFDELEHQHDAAWIGGPGISEWNFEKGTLGFMKNPAYIYFQSEETGFSHLYMLELATKKKTALTSGNWEVRNVNYSNLTNLFYISANKTHPGNLDFYHLNPSTKVLTAICNKDGAHDVVVSPDEKKIALLYSSKTQPWDLFWGKNNADISLSRITQSQTPEYKAQTWKAPEVISFKAKDQTDVYARLYHAKENSNKAAVIFVHGAGYLQNAHNHWSNYYREFMFHNLLLEKGYTVLDIDYRASDGYGRDFRTGIYRHMGGLDLKDHLDGRQLLIDKYGIDSTRIGIYGGSYGGFITLMALLTEPGKFKCGAALRSVTDWAHYNQEYTSNILNFPETDPEAYRKSSPIYFAENLQDQLLMLHGMVDDNVQFQDIVRLTERFIELGKTTWDLAIYPVEAHGFKESYSWLDEYRRILELMENNLVK